MSAGDTDQTSPSSPFRCRFCSSRAYVLSQNSRLPSSQSSSSSSSVWLAAIPTDAGVLYRRSIRKTEGSVDCDRTTAGQRRTAAAAQSLFWLVSERCSVLRPVLGSALCPARLVLTRGCCDYHHRVQPPADADSHFDYVTRIFPSSVRKTRLLRTAAVMSSGTLFCEVWLTQTLVP